MNRRQFCFVTEADLDRQGVGGVTTDLEMLRSLREFGDVDIIYLARMRYKPTPLALTVFSLQILRSFSRSYNAYFTRGVIASLLLAALNALALGKRRVVQRALSVPFGTEEIRFLAYNRLEYLIRNSLFVLLERFAYFRADFITVAADVCAKALVQAGIKPDKIHVTNFTVGAEFFNQPIKLDSRGAFSFCYVGGFHPYQDLSPMLEAFRMLRETNKNIELILVGDGPQRSTLEERAKELELGETAKFVGKIPHSSLPSFLSTMDCFISLTRKPGLSISLVEAAAAGKPTIAFAPKNEASYNGFFTHRESIFLVNSASPNEIARAMNLLYEDSPLRNALAQGARRVAKRYFNKRVAKEQLEELIKKLS